MLIRQLLLNGLIAGSIYALVALGFSLIYGVCRFFHFAHAAVITCAAYLAWTFVHRYSLSMGTSCLLAIICSALLGIVFYVFIYDPLLRLEAGDLQLLLASLGIYVIVQNVISMSYGDQYRSLAPDVISDGVGWLGAKITGIQATTFVTDVVLYFGVGLLLGKTTLGRTIRAVANDPQLAGIRGINQRRIFVIVFGLGSALGGIAGILLGIDGTVNPTMGFDALLMGVTAAIIGGVGSVAGAIIGGFGIALLEVVAAWHFPTFWGRPIVFLLLIVCLVFRPYGIMNKRGLAAS